MKYLKSNYPILLYIVIALYFSITWIPFGKYLGGGDVGIPTYNVERALQVISHPWWANQGTGSINPVSYTAIPLYLFFVLIAHIADASIIQKVFFFLINIISAGSVYFIAKEMKINKLPAFFAGVFYISSFFALTVWHRGVNNMMLFLAYAPLTFLLLIKGLSEKRYIYIFWISLTTFFFSYVYGSPALILTTWLLWGSTILWRFLFSEKVERLYILKFLSLLIILWLISNVWWLVHFIESSGYVFGSLGETTLKSASSEVIIALKQQTQLTEILRGISKYQIFDEKSWGELYLFKAVRILLWIPFLIFIRGLFLIRDKEKKESYFNYFILLFLVVVFISKGINEPFGSLVKASYDLVSYMILLRNPYEKVGLILALPYSMIIAYVLNQFVNIKFDQKFISYLKKICIVSIFLLGLLTVWPVWTGNVYMGSENSLIKIPSYYSDADSYISSQNINDKRILHLPLSNGEAVSYDWGYSGIEPSQLLFKGSSISYKTGIPTSDKYIDYISEAVRYHDADKLQRLISNLDVGWLVVHLETDWKARGMLNPKGVNEWLGSLNYLTNTQTIGPLQIWKVNENYLSEKIKAIQDVSVVIDANKSDVSLLNLTGHFITNQSTTDSDPSEIKLITSSYTSVRDPFLTSLYDPNQNFYSLPFARFAPSSPFYPLIRFKENIDNLTSFASPFYRCITIAGKRLSETVLVKDDKNIDIENLLSRYSSQLLSCADYYKTTSYPQDNASGRLYLKEVMRDQEKVLDDNFSNEKTKITYDAIRKFELITGIYPPYPLKADVKDKANVITLNFNIIKGGNYSLRLEYNGCSPQILPSMIQVDDKVVNKTAKLSEKNSIIFSPIQLSSGSHILYLDKDDSSPITVTDQSIISSSQNKSELSIKLQNIKPCKNYQISFDYQLKNGNPPEFILTQNSDTYDSMGKFKNKIFDEIPKDPYRSSSISESYQYTPDFNADSADVKLLAIDWDDCKARELNGNCDDPEVKKKYTRPSTDEINNFKIVQSDVFSAYLVSSDSKTNDNIETILSYKKIDNTDYEINTKGINTPFYLEFLETNHPGWGLYDDNGNSLSFKKVVIDGFANGWYIDKKLPDKTFIRFRLEDTLKNGVKYTLIGLVSLSTALWFINKKWKN